MSGMWWQGGAARQGCGLRPAKERERGRCDPGCAGSGKEWARCSGEAELFEFIEAHVAAIAAKEAGEVSLPPVALISGKNKGDVRDLRALAAAGGAGVDIDAGVGEFADDVFGLGHGVLAFRGRF